MLRAHWQYGELVAVDGRLAVASQECHCAGQVARGEHGNALFRARDGGVGGVLRCRLHVVPKPDTKITASVQLHTAVLLPGRHAISGLAVRLEVDRPHAEKYAPLAHLCGHGERQSVHVAAITLLDGANCPFSNRDVRSWPRGVHGHSQIA